MTHLCRPIRLSAALAYLLVSCGGNAGEATRPIDFEVSEGTNLAFDLSPDGETLVLDLLGQLWLLPAEGGEAQPLTDAARDTADDAGPVFSPDGDWIVFQSDRPGGLGLFRVPVRGGAPERLTTNWPDQFGGSNPAWSPNGRSVAFAFDDTLYVIDARAEQGEAPARPMSISFPQRRPRGLGAPTWSPDGERIAFSTGSGGAFRAFAGTAASRVWEVPEGGGEARPLSAEGVAAVSPAYSPDGEHLAFFARDTAQAWQLWVQPYREGPARQLTDHNDMAIRTARWTPDGRQLVYAAGGRLWRTDVSGGPPTMIPFTARVRFQRRIVTLPPVGFPEPGTSQLVRGFESIALSPDGNRIAMIALGRLWVWSVGQPANVVAEIPAGSTSLTWSADGTEIAFTNGDLYAVDTSTGSLRRLSSLPGNEELPAWSPDGRWIAFIHGRECRDGPCTAGRIRLMRPDGPVVSDTLGTETIGTPPPSPRPVWSVKHPPAWRPDSRAVLTYNAYLNSGRASVAHVSGAATPLTAFPATATFLTWTASDSVLFVRGNRLWTAGFDEATGAFDAPAPLSDDAALYPSAAANGSVLYVSVDGLRLRRPGGEVERLGWPASFTVPDAPPPILVRNARVVDGRGGEPLERKDLLIENGRIVRISDAGTIDQDLATEIIDAEGRTVLPGFIDTHRHLFSRTAGLRQMLGALYYGTTTFRDAGSSVAQIADLRDLVASGAVPGPRLVVSGYIFHGPPRSPDAESRVDPGNQYVLSKDQIARGVGISRAFGAELVKHRGYFNWASLVTTIDEAHDHGMRVSGHCTGTLVAAAAGADGKEHAAQCFRDLNRVQSDFAELGAASEMWAAVTPAIFLPELVNRDTGLASRPDISPFLAPEDSEGQDTAPRPPRDVLVDRYTNWRASTTTLLNSGVPLAVGTDREYPNMTQLTLVALVEAGMTTLEALSAATYTGAQAIGAESEIGSIEVGKLADLVIFDADPLEDISNAERVWQVIKGGRLVDRQELTRLAGTLNTP